MEYSQTAIHNLNKLLELCRQKKKQSQFIEVAE